MKIEIKDINDLMMLPHLYKITETLKIAIYLNIFSVLSNRKLSIAEIENACKVESLRPILELLCKMELLHVKSGYYYNSEIAEKYLCNNMNLCHFLFYSSNSNYNIEKMKCILKIGGSERHNLSHIELYMKAMDEGNKYIAQSVFRKLKIKGEKSLLDLGCGSGIFSITFAKYNPLLKIVGVDKADVLEITKKNIAAHGMSKQLKVLAGDFCTMEIEGKYDYILLSNVLHFYQKESIRGIVERIQKNLKPGGTIAIVDIFSDREYFMNALYSLEWLSNGVCFANTPDMYSILSDCNYSEVEIRPIRNSYSNLIMAKCPLKEGKEGE